MAKNEQSKKVGSSFDVYLAYDKFLRKAKRGDPEYDRYLEHLVREMKEYDQMNPLAGDSLKSFIQKSDSFLKHFRGISYADFVKHANPRKFKTNDFRYLPDSGNLKKRLFEHRARLYLSALKDYAEEVNYDSNKIRRLLDKIASSTIPYLKKEKDEPTFLTILRTLNNKYEYKGQHSEISDYFKKKDKDHKKDDPR